MNENKDLSSRVSSEELARFIMSLENERDLSAIVRLFWENFSRIVEPAWGCFYWRRQAERLWTRDFGHPEEELEKLPDSLDEKHPAVTKVCRLKMAGTNDVCKLTNRYQIDTGSFGHDRGVLLLAFGAESRIPALLALGKSKSGEKYSLSDIFFMHQLIGMCFQVYERAELSIQLLTADKEVTVSMVAAGIAHEINNNITPIIGRAQLMDKHLKKIADENVARELEASVKVIYNQGCKIARIAANLKKLSEPVRLEIQELSMEDELRAAIEIMSETAGKIKHFKTDDPDTPFVLILDFQPNLPPVSGDSQQLQQVFINLIINAAHAIEEKGRGTLTVGARKGQDNNVVAFIEDTGIGMTEETMKKLWEPFYTTKKEGKGTGLGMAIVKNVIEAHRGEIKVESKFGKGTVFELTFKAAH